MRTEKNIAEKDRAGWVLYDGECSMCIRLASWFAPMLCRHRFDLAPLQTPWVRQRLNLIEGQPLDEMRVLSQAGVVVGGADAVVFLARRIWWAWPMYLIARLPGAMSMLRRIYAWVAARRHCAAGQCRRSPQTWPGWLPLYLVIVYGWSALFSSDVASL